MRQAKGAIITQASHHLAPVRQESALLEYHGKQKRIHDHEESNGDGDRNDTAACIPRSN